MTEWEGWSTGNCAGNWNSTILPNGTCTNQNLSRRMGRINFSGILRGKQITESQPEDEMIVRIKKEKKRESAVLWNHRVKFKENEKESQVLEPCMRTKKATKQVSNVDANCY